MFRQIGKLCREAWLILAGIGWVVARNYDLLDGHWLETYGDVISLLLFAWLVLFAIGVAREEPTP